MTWDEDKHPRDEKGQFTFKNGESSSSTKEQPADILYRDSKIKAKKDRQEAEYKSKLLDILGNKAKPTGVLYGTTKELEEKVKEYGLENKLKGSLTGGAASTGQPRRDFTRPVEGIIKSDFGPRTRPVEGASSNHQGIDFRAPIGTPVKSVASGTVIKAGSASGYGIAVYIDHGVINGKHVVSEYGHLSKCNVKVGDKINAGQVVAKSGNSGRSSGPHLHLTIKENGKAVDPKKYIKLK